MKVSDLAKIANEAIKNGYGDKEVFFDTEAARFHTHLVDIRSATINEPIEEICKETKELIPGITEACLILYFDATKENLEY